MDAEEIPEESSSPTESSNYEPTNYEAPAPNFPEELSTTLAAPTPEEMLNFVESPITEEPTSEALTAETPRQSSASEDRTNEKEEEEEEAHSTEESKSPVDYSIDKLSTVLSLSANSPETLSESRAKEHEEQDEEFISEDHTQASHRQTRGKKAAKKTIPRYTLRPIVPADKPEVLAVAKTMHREKFGSQVKQLFQWEKDAALKAIQSGIYIGWRCPHYLWDCYRIGNESKCFCGHLLVHHRIVSDMSVPCTMTSCRCQMFCFIPSRPEEVGEFWLQKRSGFDPKAWRALCRCKHSHEEHLATGSHACKHRGCRCNFFESNFLCAACDRRWEEHETFFESEETRRRGGRPIGADYLPFAEMPALRDIILPASEFEALVKQSPPGTRKITLGIGTHELGPSARK